MIRVYCCGIGSFAVRRRATDGSDKDVVECNMRNMFMVVSVARVVVQDIIIIHEVFWLE